MTKLLLTNIRSKQQSIAIDRGSLGLTNVLVQPGATVSVEGVNAAIALQSLDHLIVAGGILVGFDDDTVYSPKILPPVEVATTANLASLTGTPTVDTVALRAGDRILVKNQTDAKLNGIYIVSAGGWRRDPNLSVTDQFTPYISVFVKQGAANGGGAFVLSAATNPVVGVDNVSWTDWPSSPISNLAVADGGTGASTAQGAQANLRVAPATVADATDTLSATDDATVILYTSAAAVTVTLADIATGFEAVLVCLGAGGLSVDAGGMSFANGFTPNLTVAQGEALFVKQTAASTWVVIGGTSA